MIEGYGLTEAVTAVMANPYHGLHKSGSVGLPFPGVDARIVALDDGRDLGPGGGLVEPHPAGRGLQHRRAGPGDNRCEADPEMADGIEGVALGRGTQRGQGGDTRCSQRRTSVGHP